MKAVETKAVVLDIHNESGGSQRVITWTDRDLRGQVVIRTVTLHITETRWGIEVEEWDAYQPDLLLRGAGDCPVAPVY